MRMTSYKACAIAEGFGGYEGASAKLQKQAWQHLIDSGECWELQGWYGRTARRLIDQGICKPASSRRKMQSQAKAAKVINKDQDLLIKPPKVAPVINRLLE